MNLAHYFSGIAAKRLSMVEVDIDASNQHEFNGVESLVEILGRERQKFKAEFIYSGVDSESTISESSTVTWYDARERHPSRSEFRLYYPSCTVMSAAKTGDLMLLARRLDNTLLIYIAQAGSSVENSILWLFGLQEQIGIGRFTVRTLETRSSREVDFASRRVLEQIGVEVEEAQEALLNEMLRRFRGKFPQTVVFSEFARESVGDATPVLEPDLAIQAWMEQEERLFRTLERHLVEKRLESGFADVDEFVSFSLSVHNRRKSRAGYALENHLEALFILHNIAFVRGAQTENNSRPDFIFPGIDAYRNPRFPEDHLTMLGVKATCKDRWRQVLSEAQRVRSKHLLTLEAGITQNQTDEMRTHSLQLVVPQGLHQTYNTPQQSWLWSVRQFIGRVLNLQNHLSSE